MSTTDSSTYRLYLGPEPDGPHPGYRGQLRLAPEGVWCPPDAELGLDLNSYTLDWEPIDRLALIPWHRIHSIEVMS